jgi:hypothetical protein
MHAAAQQQTTWQKFSYTAVLETLLVVVASWLCMQAACTNLLCSMVSVQALHRSITHTPPNTLLLHAAMDKMLTMFKRFRAALEPHATVNSHL